MLPAPAAEEHSEECKLFLTAVELQASSDWYGAYEAFLEYLAAYPQGSMRAQARQSAAECMLASAGQELAAREYADCANHTGIILKEYRDTTVYNEARQLSETNYRTWAAWLIDLGRFEEARALAATSEDFRWALLRENRPDLAEPARTAVVVTPTAVVYSPEAQVEAMQDAVSRMCRLQLPPDDPRFASDHTTVRAYPMSMTATEYGPPEGNYRALSDEVLAKTPETLHYAVCVSLRDREVGTCKEAGALVSRRVRDWEIRVLQIQTAREVANTEIAGGDPGPCAERMWFFGNVAQLHGAFPDPGDLDVWLRGVLEEAGS